MKNFETKNKKELEWTEEKYKLVELIADIPGDARYTFEYLYAFIGYGMLDGKFCMSNGHQEELEKLNKERQENERQKEAGRIKEKDSMSSEEKRMNDYICKIVNNIMIIRERKREDILRYIHIIIDDIVKEKQVWLWRKKTYYGLYFFIF